MLEAAPTPEESRRLRTLHALGLLDTPAEERFDRITRMAQRLFGVPIALISLVDQDRQWFKSRQGLAVRETPRDVSFCAHAILGDDPLVVSDALTDPRFADNPLVVDDPNIRFYAGCPIAAPDGSKLGTLCVIDRLPRSVDEDDLLVLRDLADLLESEIGAVEASILDEMTGLANRRGFQVVADKVLGVCARRSLPAVLVYADLDRLKSVNDSLGHAAGDQMIRAAAGVLDEAFRASDIVARLGGDEFAVLLSGTDDAEPALGRLRALIHEHNGRQPGGGGLSISVGTASYDPGQPETVDELMARADAQMYEAKGERRPLDSLDR